MRKIPRAMILYLAIALLLSSCNLGSRPEADQAKREASEPVIFLPVVGGATGEEAAAAQETPTNEPEAAPEEPTAIQEAVQEPADTQETVKNGWRPVVNGAKYLTAACEMMFDTYIDYQVEEINLEKAQTQLAVEAELVALANQGLTEGDSSSQETATYKERLIGYMGTLNDILNRREASDLGSFETTDVLLETCLPLVDIQDEVVDAAMKAGLTEASADELESESTAIIEGFRNRLEG